MAVKAAFKKGKKQIFLTLCVIIEKIVCVRRRPRRRACFALVFRPEKPNPAFS